MEGTKIPYKMLSLDPFSQWLGIEILECEVGNCKVAMTVRKEMLNSIATPKLKPKSFAFSIYYN